MSDRVTREYDLITLLTDFGAEGGYVAACEATLAFLRPEARVLHVSHEVSVGDISEGATVLARIAPLCPVAVHVAVVDPGVGTGRRPVALLAQRGDLLVGPDNGLLMPAMQALGGGVEGWILDRERVRARAGLSERSDSSTFDGRDLFSPAAALLSAGIDAAELAGSADLTSLVRAPHCEPKTDSLGVIAQVIEVDRFGNIGLALPFDDFTPTGAAVDVDVLGEDVPQWTARFVRTYGELSAGELGLYRDSWGQAALALNGASAGEVLGVRRGMLIRISPGSSRGAATVRSGGASQPSAPMEEL